MEKLFRRPILRIIPVGEVINKVTRAGSSGPLLEIKLGADLDHLNFVKVIRYVPPNEVPG